MSATLSSRLASGRTILLDGGVGTEIRRRGATMDSAAWCAVANRTDPDIVRGVHEDYLRAGADILTANTFATARHVLDGAGIGDEAPALTRRAVELAIEARERVASDREIPIAGSMSNTVAWIAGTFSRDPRFFPTPEQEITNYREVAESLAEAGVDLIVLEMMLDLDRAARAIAAAAETGLPLWIGMSATLLDDGTVLAWDPVHEEPPERIAADAVRRAPLAFDDLARSLASAHPVAAGSAAAAAGVMHSTLEATDAALAQLRHHWSGPFLAYPEATSLHPVEPGELAGRCADWVEQGVQIVGGCCGTTPSHVAAIAEALGRNP
ncbi:MAG: homocysteine S-methyltransferase family protein [Acidobacteriota bacterium]|nr:homocysteine S-methyltransferase family protein [Acidobacteriota bacterium]